MKIRTVILAGGEGSRLGILTAKRTKPAVPFAGKYRIIDFTLSNCVNSGIFDVMILAQYRPHSLIEHIGAGAPWDLNRNLNGGVSILTPYKGRSGSDWYMGTADAVQQNYLFIKRGQPDLILILSGDHIYKMDYRTMIEFHLGHKADLTIASIRVPMQDATRFGVLSVDKECRVTSFVEKPVQPSSDLANMGVYLFNTNVLDRSLWDDHILGNSSHDFGKDVLPRLVSMKKRVFAFPFAGHWVDVGTLDSYWQAHMDLLAEPPPIDLNDRSWIIHTRTEERPPVWIAKGANIQNSMITDGCQISDGAFIHCSVLGPGIRIGAGTIIEESILLTDTEIGDHAVIEQVITDKRVQIGSKAHLGEKTEGILRLTTIGKNSRIPAGMIVEPGAVIGPDIIESDYDSESVHNGDYIQTKRLPYEI
jgi:glucose-1-phosphate adenylyltransferase